MFFQNLFTSIQGRLLKIKYFGKRTKFEPDSDTNFEEVMSLKIDGRPFPGPHVSILIFEIVCYLA